MAGSDWRSPSRPSGVPGLDTVGGRECLHLVGEDQVGDVTLDDRVLAGKGHQLGMVASRAGQSGSKRATGPNAAGLVDLLERAGTEHLGVDLPGQRENGARSTLASQRPVSMFVAPGPAMVMHAAGLPLSLA